MKYEYEIITVGKNRVLKFWEGSGGFYNYRFLDKLGFIERPSTATLEFLAYNPQFDPVIGRQMIELGQIVE